MYHGIIKQHDEDIMWYANKEKGMLFLYIYSCYMCYGVYNYISGAMVRVLS